MSPWLVCPSCALAHAPRHEPRCPRCGASTREAGPLVAASPPHGGPEPELIELAAADALPAPEAGDVAPFEVDVDLPPPPRRKPPRRGLHAVRAWLLPEPPPAGTALAGAFLCAGAVLALAQAVLSSTGLPPALRGVLGVSALADALLGAALLLRVRRAHAGALLRVGLGMLALGGLLREEPLALLLQGVVSAGLLLLLVGAAPAWRMVSGSLLLTGALGAGAVLVLSPCTQRSPLAELALELRGALEPGPATQVTGAAADYRLSLPPTGWRQARADHARSLHPALDRVWLRPERDAAVLALLEHVPGAGSADLDKVQETLLAARRKAGSTDAEVLEASPLEGDFDAGRRLHLRERLAGEHVESLVSLVVQGDYAFTLMALAPAHRFPALEEELAGILDSFAFQPPRALALRPDTLTRLRRSTAMVLTPEGSGSGVVVSTFPGSVHVATNDHVVRCQDGEPCAKLAVVLPNGFGDPTLYPASLVRTDARLDLAVLVVSGPSAAANPPVPLRHPEKLPGRLPLFTIGYPFGLLMGGGKSFPSATVNAGWLGEGTLEEERGRGRLRISAGINPGNSGGPVVDGAGRVLGLAVERIVGSETGLMIDATTLARFLQGATLHGVTFDDTPVPEDALLEPLPPADEARAREAIVAVRGKGGGTAGVVVARRGEHALVLASAEVLREDTDASVEVMVRPAEADASWQPAEVLHTSREAGLLLLEAPGVPASVEPLRPVRASTLQTTAPVSLLGFRVGENGALTQSHPVPRRQYGTLASLQRDRKGAVEFLQVDVGINHGRGGAAAFDMHGRLVGLTAARVEQTNLSLVLPGEMLAESLRGGVSGGGWMFQRTTAGRCSLHVLAVLEDPLGTLQTVALRYGPDGTQWELTREPRHVLPLEQQPVLEVPVEGRARVELLTEVPCPSGSARVQLEVRDAEGTRRTAAAAVPLEGEGPVVVRGRLGGTWLAGPPPADVLEFLLRPPLHPEAWKGDCVAQGDAACLRACADHRGEACVALGRKRLAAGAHAPAAQLFERGCIFGDVDGCVELTFARARDGEPLESDVAEALQKACAAGYGRACVARAPREFLAAMVGQEDRCDGSPDACVVLGNARLAGPGGVEANLSRGLGAYKRACDERVREGCYALAVLSLVHAEAADRVQAATGELEAGCLASHVPSCLSLAAVHARGLAGTRDLGRARELVRRACMLGDRGSCMLYGEDPAGEK